MKLNDISGDIIDAAVTIHREIGPGLLESVYEVVLAYELKNRNLKVDRQVVVPIEYRGIRFEEGYRLDLLVEDIIIIEIKSVTEVTDVHKKQLLTYLRLQSKPLGLLLNFNVNLMKQGIVRIANGVEE
jgi:GxxExxY protein